MENHITNICTLFQLLNQLTIFFLQIHLKFFESRQSIGIQVLFYLNIIIMLVVMILKLVRTQFMEGEICQFLHQFFLIILSTETVLAQNQTGLLYLLIVNVNYLEKKNKIINFLLTLSTSAVYVTLRLSINLEYQQFELVIILIQTILALIGPLIIFMVKLTILQQNQTRINNLANEIKFSPIQNSKYTMNGVSQIQSPDLPIQFLNENHQKDLKTIEINDWIKHQVQEILSEGMAIIKLGDTNKDKLEILYFNKSILGLLNIKEGSQVLQGVATLQNVKLQRVHSFSKYQYENSIYESYNFKKLFKNQGYNVKMKFSMVDSFNQIADRSSRIIYEQKEEQEANGLELIFSEIYKKLQSATYQSYLKSKQMLDLVSVLNGYSHSLTLDNQIQVEIKIYLTFYKGQAISILLVRDISHRDKIDILFEQDKAKSNQLNFVSHEFRTPLNCIITMLEMYDDQDLKRSIQLKQTNFLEIALQNCKYLLNLSNDLLDLAQLKVNKFKLKKQTFQLKEVFEDCISMFKLMAEKRNLKLTYTIEDFSNIYQDKSRIKQIIINLIGNSLKFTQTGQIKLSGKKVQQNVLEIKVSDTGVGIKKEEEGNLFKAFGQVQNTIENKKLNRSGVGLGLIISNMIAQNLSHNQQGLMFESIYGKGTQFYFYVEYRKLEDEESWGTSRPLQSYLQNSKDMPFHEATCEKFIHTPDNEIDLPQKILKSKRPHLFKQTFTQCDCSQIMIVDDNQFNLEAMRLLLLKRNIKYIDYTISGSLAIEKVKQKLCNECCSSYQLIILDLDMPLMSGIETFRIMNQIFIEKGCSTKVVACSAYDKNKTKSMVLNSGLSDYIEKPVKRDQLDYLIKNYINIQ